MPNLTISTEVAEPSIMEEKNHEWHAFFSEKEGMEFFFDPVKNIATWFLPKDDNNKDNKEEEKDEDEQEEEEKKEEEEENSCATSEEEHETPRARSRDVDASEKEETDIELKEILQRMFQPIKETYEVVEASLKETYEVAEAYVKEAPYPWMLVGIMVFCILLKLWFSRHSYPVVHRGIVMVREPQPTIDIFRRVEASFSSVVGGGEILQQTTNNDATMNNIKKKRDLKATLGQGQAILQRVEQTKSVADEDDQERFGDMLVEAFVEKFTLAKEGIIRVAKDEIIPRVPEAFAERFVVTKDAVAEKVAVAAEKFNVAKEEIIRLAKDEIVPRVKNPGPTWNLLKDVATDVRERGKSTLSSDLFDEYIVL
jgi:hypothetical protein